jgi:hypothetical protein
VNELRGDVSPKNATVLIGRSVESKLHEDLPGPCHPSSSATAAGGGIGPRFSRHEEASHRVGDRLTRSQLVEREARRRIHLKPDELTVERPPEVDSR